MNALNEDVDSKDITVARRFFEQSVQYLKELKRIKELMPSVSVIRDRNRRALSVEISDLEYPSFPDVHSRVHRFSSNTPVCPGAESLFLESFRRDVGLITELPILLFTDEVFASNTSFYNLDSTLKLDFSNLRKEFVWSFCLLCKRKRRAFRGYS